MKSSAIYIAFCRAKNGEYSQKEGVAVQQIVLTVPLRGYATELECETLHFPHFILVLSLLQAL